ncbi:hypothetical protein JXO52_15415 [bacterium]|nr:hypothetical protein [bacterium]
MGWPLLISLAIHVLILFFLVRRGNAVIFDAGPDLRQPARTQPIAFEIVETPEHARVQEPQEDATLLSDKNALAMDQAETDLPASNLPFSRGFSDVKEIPVPAGGGGGLPSRSAMEQAGEDRSEAAMERQGTGAASIMRRRSAASEFRSDVLLGAPANRRSASYRQEQSSAAETGGMSFNTYEWEFAPYMLELKKKIQKNIFPPTAFTRLGFGGQNVITFRIYPDGRLEGPEVLRVEGERALAETSCKAVLYSAPFTPLPENFPEEYLEVTARFEYFIARD